MAAWQRLSAGAACAGQGAPCPQFLRHSTSRSVGLYNLCCGMCRGSRLFPCEGAGCCREGGTAARAFRNNCAHRSIPRSPPRSSPGQALCREQAINRPHKTEHVPMEGEKTKQTNNKTKALLQRQAGVVALRALSEAAALGAGAARAAARSLPGRERRWARTGTSAEHPARVTAAPSDRLLAKSEGMVTFLAEHH